MHKQITCILCPNGCEIQCEYVDGAILSVQGNKCNKGQVYFQQELTDPRRSIASLVKVNGGELPLVSVRVTAPIPREMIFPVVAEIKKQELDAPVHLGQIVIANVLGLGCDVIATKNVSIG